MAKIPQGILGGIRGRVGNIIGAAWKGINYIRSMPLSVANPNTAAQQAQRGAFTMCVAAARLLLAALIATYWDPFARYMSGYNSFISVNIGAFATAGLDDPTAFFASRGILTGFKNLVVTADASNNSINLSYDDNSGTGDALATDEVKAFWYNETQDYWLYNDDPTHLRDGTTFAPPDAILLENDVLQVYCFLGRPDVSRISDSEHNEVIVAA